MYFITMPLLSQRTRPDREDVSFLTLVFIPVYWTRDRTPRVMSGGGRVLPSTWCTKTATTPRKSRRIPRRGRHIPRRGRSSYPRRGGLHLPRKGCLSECTLSHKKSLLTICVYMWERPLRARPCLRRLVPSTTPTTHQTGPSLT